MNFQRQAANQAEPITVPPIVHEVLRSPGQPLDPATRAFMEPRFGHDFSQVRVHSDSRAAESAQAVNALAYTIGWDVVFGAGQYAPHQPEGLRLLAHELAHVVQQASASAVPTGAMRLEQTSSPLEHEAERWAAAASQPAFQAGRSALLSVHPAQLGIARQPLPGAERAEEERRRAPRAPGRGRRAARPIVDLRTDSQPARIDTSKGVDEITRDFYAIPIELIPPNTPIPAGPILTLGRWGCDIRRYGLTGDDFSLSLNFDEADMQMSSHPFNLGGSASGMHTVQCWTDHVEFRARLRQTIWLPNDIATHPCLRGRNPGQFRAEILAHERLHEADNNRAVDDTLRSLRARLGFTPGIGPLFTMVRITSDPQAFMQECTQRLRATLERLRAEHDLMYHRLSAEYSSQLDPHDRELHELKLRLLEQARARAAAEE